MPPGAETVWHWEFDPWVLALILLPGRALCLWLRRCTGRCRPPLRRSPGRVPAGLRPVHCHRLAAACVRGPVADGAHAPAPAVDAHRAAAAPRRRAVPAAAARLPRRCGQARAGRSSPGRRCGAVAAAHASADGLLAFVVTSNGLACARRCMSWPLRSPGWHEVEHLCFVSTALLFWWPVISPWPSRPQGPRWCCSHTSSWRMAEHHPRRLSDLLRARALPDVCQRPAAQTLDDSARRPGRRGRDMWVLGSVAFLNPRRLHHHPGAAGAACAVRPGLWSSWRSTATAERNRRRRAGPEASWALLSIPLIGAAGGLALALHTADV